MNDIYTSAVINARLGSMLTSERIRRMVAMPTASEAAKILMECGWEIIENDDDMINAERARIVADFTEFCTDEKLRYATLARFDYHNAGVLYNNGTGLYPFSSIKSIKDYALLPEQMARGLRFLDTLNNPTPAQVEAVLQKCMYSDIKLNDYFRAEIDITNLRLAAKKVDEFIEDGTLDETVLKTLHHYDTEYNEVAKALTHSLERFENVSGQFLIEKAKQGAEVFYWFIKRLEELRIVKTILVGKKFGRSREELLIELGGVL